MIFVSVGTVSYPFPRLVEGALEIFEKNQSERVLIQTGETVVTKINTQIEVVSYLTLEQMRANYQKARIVISAAGEASLLMMLKYCRNKPILFPRLKKYKEQVDDQQADLARAAQKRGYAVVAWNKQDLTSLCQNAQVNSVGLKVESKSAQKRLLSNLRSITEG